MKPRFISFLIGILFINPNRIQAQTIDTLVNVGTHNIHFNIIKGEGIPMLFESGGGNDGSIWNRLLKPISKIIGTTLITYDRAGYGKSDVNPNLPDDKKAFINNGIKDLEKGLQSLGYDKEIILVAHSYGGFYAAYFAAKHPEKVKGTILIDANHIDFFTDDYMLKDKERDTPEQLNYIRSLSEAAYFESLAFPETVKMMRTIQIPKSIPIIDFVANNPPDFENDEDTKRWKSCHEAFVKESPNRTGIIALNCGHYLHFDNPKLAIDAIVKMYVGVSPNLDYKSVLQRSLDYGIESSNSYKKREYEYWHSERETNAWGYKLLNDADNIEIALKIFELNTILYPNSANVWDSYGEALLKAREKEKAIKMYQKSIALNPNNENAKNVLKEMAKD